MSRQFIKTISFWIMILLWDNYLCAQSPDTLWTKTYGGISWEYCYSSQQTTDGGYILFGQTMSYGAGGDDVYLIKTDSLGDTLWTRTYGGAEDDYARSGAQTFDGGYIIAGSNKSVTPSNIKGYLIKTDADGDTLWTRVDSGGSFKNLWYSVQQTSDSGYIVAGTIWPTMYQDVYLIKTDASGNTQWKKTYGGMWEDLVGSVQQTSEGGYIVAGMTQSFGAGSYDIWLLKTDANGDTLWTKTYGGTSWDYGMSVQQTTDSGYIVTGCTNSFCVGYSDVWFLRTDASGDTLWTKTYGSTGVEGGRSVRQTADGGYIIVGFTDSYGAGELDIYFLRTDANGDTIWTKTYGGPGDDFSASAQQTSDCGYMIAGYTDLFGAQLIDIWLIKIAPDTFGIEENEMLPPTTKNLSFEVLPNPFSNEVNITYTIESSMSAVMNCITLKIYDVSGVLVNEFIKLSKQPFNHIVWQGTDSKGKQLPSGIYFMRLETAGQTAIQKIVIVD